MADLPGDPSYSTVRTQLRVLETKGHVRHEEQGLRYVYVPAASTLHYHSCYGVTYSCACAKGAAPAPKPPACSKK